MAIEASDLILIALLSGIGSGIGNPIGQWIFRRFVERPFKGLTDVNTSALRSQYTDSLKLLDALDVAKKKLKQAREEVEMQGGVL